MTQLLLIIGLAVVALVAFAYLSRRGAFLRVTQYIRETQEELKKCTWPTWDELKGSTVVVVVAIALLGGFTVGIDFVVTLLVKMIV